MANPVIFIVDDDEEVRAAFVRLIHSVGLEARPYESAERFLDEIGDVVQGCVLLDLMMPRVTGQQILKRLGQRGCELPVIIVSAHDDDVTRATTRDLGAHMFLSKPVDDQALIDAISGATGCSIEAGS